MARFFCFGEIWKSGELGEGGALVNGRLGLVYFTSTQEKCLPKFCAGVGGEEIDEE
jgi:hypothetical protein